jgi:hypothetical protein
VPLAIGTKRRIYGRPGVHGRLPPSDERNRVQALLLPGQGQFAMRLGRLDDADARCRQPVRCTSVDRSSPSHSWGRTRWRFYPFWLAARSDYLLQALHGLGMAAHGRGQMALSRQHLRRTLQLAVNAQITPLFLTILVGIGTALLESEAQEWGRRALSSTQFVLNLFDIGCCGEKD